MINRTLAPLSLGSWPPCYSMLILFFPSILYMHPKAAICCGIHGLGCRPTTKDGLCWASLHVHAFQILRTCAGIMLYHKRLKLETASLAIWNDLPLRTKACVLAVKYKYIRDASASSS